MSYIKTIWNETTAIIPSLLNKIEDGIKDAHDAIAGINWSTLSGKPSTFAPSSHDNSAHSTNYEPAFSKNSAFNRNFGTGANTVCQGNDARLSNARTPLEHDNSAHSTNYEPALAANRKRQIFVQSGPPSGQATGDLWIW